METGTVIVHEPIDGPAGIALYARVSSADQKDDLVRQLERLQTYAIAKGDTVSRIVTEVGSGLNESRPKLTALLRDGSIVTIQHAAADKSRRVQARGYLQELGAPVP